MCNVLPEQTECLTPGEHEKCLTKSAGYPKLQMWRSWLAMFSFLAPERLKPHREPSLPQSPSTWPVLSWPTLEVSVDWVLFQGTTWPEQTPFLLSRFSRQIIREWQRANESWTVSKLGETVASGMRGLCLPSLFGRKRSKQGRKINNAWDRGSGQGLQADTGLHWSGHVL